MSTYVWLVLLIVFIVVELATVGLITVWFAIGSLAALILSALGANIAWQVTVFIVISVALLVLTRPLVEKYINSRHVKTNADAIIGMSAKVVEAINGIEGTGAVLVDGKTWSARAVSEEISIEKDTIVRVKEISGVKLIVEPVA